MYELIRKQPGLEASLTDSQYYQLPSSKKQYYRRKEDSGYSRPGDTTYHSSTDHIASPQSSDFSPSDFDGFGGGDAGDGGAGGD